MGSLGESKTKKGVNGLERAVASLSSLGGQDKDISSFYVISVIFAQFFRHFRPHFGLPGG